MSRRVDLSDPSFEPTDEELIELSRRAFAGVAERTQRALEELRADIERRRAEVLGRLRQLPRGAAPTR